MLIRGNAEGISAIRRNRRGGDGFRNASHRDGALPTPVPDANLVSPKNSSSSDRVNGIYR